MWTNSQLFPNSSANWVINGLSVGWPFPDNTMTQGQGPWTVYLQVTEAGYPQPAQSVSKQLT
jgi:hypothetical protein